MRSGQGGIVWVLGGMAMVFGLMACQTPSGGTGNGVPPDERVVDPSQCDNQNAYRVAPGTVLTICLPSNPSTGYSWAPDPYNQKMLQLQDALLHLPKTKPGMVGVPGTYVWHFRAIRPGRTRLAFKLFRPWEGVGSTVQSHTVDVIVE